jgi:hypothetical protein
MEAEIFNDTNIMPEGYYGLAEKSSNEKMSKEIIEKNNEKAKILKFKGSENAFPIQSWRRSAGYNTPNENIEDGLTKREYFASKAMCALIERGKDPALIAKQAVDFADALILKLNEK